MTLETLAGRSTHVVRMGEGGTPTVAIHCSLGRSEMLVPLVKALGLTTEVTLFDLPGHGSSEDWDEKGEYQLVAAQQALELCESPSHLIGHSFGATVALRAAIEAREKVTQLTLIEPVFFAAAKEFETWEGHRRSFAPFERAVLDRNWDKAAEVFNEMWGIAPWTQLPDEVQQSLTAHIPLIPMKSPSLEDDVAGVLKGDALERLDIPVTLIRGSESPAIIADIHKALVKRLPNATDHVVDGAWHMLPITHVAHVAEIIQSVEASEHGD